MSHEIPKSDERRLVSLRIGALRMIRRTNEMERSSGSHVMDTLDLDAFLDLSVGGLALQHNAVNECLVRSGGIAMVAKTPDGELPIFLKRWLGADVHDSTKNVWLVERAHDPQEQFMISFDAEELHNELITKLES